MKTKWKSTAAAIFLFLCASAAFSLPHVAVLDTFLSSGMDPTVSAPITDMIMEELVNSGEFKVIDRMHVVQVLEEKEFQLSSGIVRNEEMRQAGEYLGADFVVVANASRVGSTYVITAKMISVVTGEIAVQASSEKRGKIDVLLEVARYVGRQISGQETVVVEAARKEEEKKTSEADVQPDAPSSALAVAQLQELIRKRTHMKKNGSAQMFPLVARLSEQERLLLYTSNRKGNAVSGLLLNLLLPSVGSWVQGDSFGGLMELALFITGAAAVIGGSEYDPLEDEYEQTSLHYIGIGLLITNLAYMCIRPFIFVRQWNQNLATILKLPYIALLNPETTTLSIMPTEKGVDWRFAVNLVSVEY